MGRGGEVDMRNRGGEEAAEGAGGGGGGETDVGKGETGGGEMEGVGARSDVVGVGEGGRAEASGAGSVATGGWPKLGTSSKTRTDCEGGALWAGDHYSQEKLRVVCCAGVALSVGSRGARMELPAVSTAENTLSEVQGAK